MKYIVLTYGILFITPALAQQQPPEYTFSHITSAEADLISDGLQTQPFGKVFPLISKMRSQIIEQQAVFNKPPAPAVPPVEPPKPAPTDDPKKE